MTRFAFEIPGKPMGKGRPRFGGGRTYTPAATLNAEQWVKHHALQAGVTPIEGPVLLDITAVASIPKSWTKKRRAEALATGWDTRKPDADNIAKLIADSLNGIAWADDAQVARCVVDKRLSVDGSEKVVVIVRALNTALHADFTAEVVRDVSAKNGWTAEHPVDASGDT